MRIVWTEPAANALESIQDHIARDNRRAAWEVGERVRHAINQQGTFPKLCRPGRVRGTLEPVIPGLPYIVPYRIKGGEIQVLTVYHSSRKWPEQLEYEDLKRRILLGRC